MNKTYKLVFSACLIILCLLAGNAVAATGDTVSANGTFNDVVTGFTAKLELSAEEDIGPDYGHTRYFLFARSAPGRWAIRSCSTNGAPGVYVDGTKPLTQIQCGRNARMRVSINKCRVKIQTHAYVHSDYPFVTFSGPSTTEAVVHNRDGKWWVSMSIYTPKSKVKIQGPFTGELNISSCK
jgi:hypothetical protein